MLKFFEKNPKILAVMSERGDGSMKLFADANLNLENRKRFFEKIGISKSRIISAEIIHGTKVEIVSNTSPELVLGADGLITKDRNVFLSATVADCIPVYFHEPQEKIVAVIHCGWRGIVGGIIENVIEKILEIQGKAENLRVALGPGIDRCHFEIKKDVLDDFASHLEFIIRKDDKIFVDLKGIIKKQLLAKGVDLKNLENNNDCTVEKNTYFSFRRDKPKLTEAMIAVIGLE